jgi:hypothetical protein
MLPAEQDGRMRAAYLCCEGKINEKAIFLANNFAMSRAHTANKSFIK